MTDSAAASRRRLETNHNAMEAAHRVRQGVPAVNLQGRQGGVTGVAMVILADYVRGLVEERDLESDPLAIELYDFAIALALLRAEGEVP